MASRWTSLRSILPRQVWYQSTDPAGVESLIVLELGTWNRVRLTADISSDCATTRPSVAKYEDR